MTLTSPRPHRLSDLTHGIRQDLGFALRQLRLRPGFAVLIVLTLAVGIGPNVAIFSVLRALMLRPLPYPAPDRLVQVWETDVAGRWRQPFSYPDFQDLHQRCTSFTHFGVHTPRAYNIGGGEPERVTGTMATASALRAYGVEPALGRLFSDAEVEASARVVVLSDGLWTRRYDRDPAIVGHTVIINGEGHEVVGVMPAGYEFLSPWTIGSSVELWTPLSMTAARSEGRNSHWLLAIARLEPGVTWQSAEAEIRSIATALQQEHPNSNARTQMWLVPLLVQIVGDVGGQLLVLLGAVGLVLLIACANVASMLLARGAGRLRELAIRASLGARRRRLVAQLLTESMLLSVLGGIAGVLLGIWCLAILRGLIPPDLPRAAGIGIDGGVLLFALVLTLLTGLAFGMFPALAAARTSIVETLRKGSGSLAGGRTRRRMLGLLAVAQLAVAFMLAIGAALLFASLRNVLHLDQVFAAEEVITCELSLAGGDYEEDAVRVATWEQLVERVDALPGVERAAVTTKLPLEGGTNGWILVEGETYDPNRRGRLVEFSYVSPGYFEAMGIPLLSGRVHQDGDGDSAERIALVNRAMVDHYWPDTDPIGQRVRSNSEPPMWTAVVVGVVENVRQWGAVYRPLAEMYFPFAVNPWQNSKLVVRAAGEPDSVIPSIRAQVLELDDDLPIANVRTMEQVLAGATRGRTFLLTLISLFAAIALVLAAAGIFGITSYNVAQRTREIGVRVAFGAGNGDLLAMILRSALRLAAVGVAVGVALVVAFSLILRSQLVGVAPLDPLYLSGGALFMTAVALIASGIPALRATRVNPVEALRAE